MPKENAAGGRRFCYAETFFSGGTEGPIISHLSHLYKTFYMVSMSQHLEEDGVRFQLVLRSENKNSVFRNLKEMFILRVQHGKCFGPWSSSTYISNVTCKCTGLLHAVHFTDPSVLKDSTFGPCSSYHLSCSTSSEAKYTSSAGMSSFRAASFSDLNAFVTVAISSS